MKIDKLKKIDEYAWIRRVILSCDTLVQNQMAYELINIFYKKYNDLTYTLKLLDLSVEMDNKLV